MPQEFFTKDSLSELATDIRDSPKKTTLLFAYNGAGKTRLSVEFKNIAKEAGEADTLYFNAFTEDLFIWDNDLENDTIRVLGLNKDSRFFEGLETLEMDNKIRPLLHRYANFNFLIDYDEGKVNFIREELVEGVPQNLEYIKISRGEENLFYWCFFLAIAQLAIDGEEAYGWVKNIYIDDPISSLDDGNSIAVAHHLSNLIKTEGNELKTIVSTHHALFFNVLCNEFKNARKLFLHKRDGIYHLKSTHDSPFIYHISMIQFIQKAIDNDQLFTFHFSLLRNILEKAANFHGFTGFGECMIIDDEDPDNTLHSRMVNILNHGGYSLFEPIEMGDENKRYFKQIFDNYLANYKFNDELFEEAESTVDLA